MSAGAGIFLPIRATMKSPILLAAVSCLALGAAELQAQLIIKPYQLVGTSSVTTVSFNQWNPTNGPLTNVSLTLAGAVSGVFEVFNTSPTGADLTVSNARTQQTFTFDGPSAPPAIFTTNMMTLNTLPSTVPSFAVIEGYDSQVFILTNNMPIQLSGFSTNYTDPGILSYFTGTGTITISIYNQFRISGDGPRNLDSSGLTTSGTIELNLIPEPSTYALLGLSALSLGYFAWRRRTAGTKATN
jgi:hypothetical protein